MKKFREWKSTYDYADFYVSPDGNDDWSGKLPEPSSDKSDGPFASIERARDAVRYIKKNIYRNIYVLIRGGEYKLKKAVKFMPQDSHYDSYKIVYAAYPDEVPVFSSDVFLSGWKLSDGKSDIPKHLIGKIYETNLPELPNGKKRFYTLYDDGKLLKRASSKGFQPREANRSGDGCVDCNKMLEYDRKEIKYPKGSLKKWDNLSDIEIYIQPLGFTTNYLQLESVDEDNLIAHTNIDCAYSMGKINKHQLAINGGAFRVENCIDYLDTPGEWVINTKRKKVYYYPINDVPRNVTFPLLTELFLADGHRYGGLVKNISFEGLTFTRTERYTVTDDDIGLQHEWDYFDSPNAMLRFRDAHECNVEKCRFFNGASAGIRFDLNCQSNYIRDNLFDYVGGTGILLCGYGPGLLNVNKCNHVLNNHIHHCGEFYYQSPAIMLWQSCENIVKNNLIHNVPYDSIVLSGVRPSFFNAMSQVREMAPTIRRDEISSDAQFQLPEGEYNIFYKQWKKVSPYYHTHDNIIEDNEMFSTMTRLFDGNAIYLSDVGDNNLIIRNYIHHLNGIGMQQAIRADAFIKNTLIKDNIIYNCTGGGINTKYYENNVFNNIIADIKDIVYEDDNGNYKKMFIGYLSLWSVFDKKDMPPNTKLSIKRNILYKTNPVQTFYRKKIINGKFIECHLEDCEIDNNLYYDVNAKDKGKSKLRYYQSRNTDMNGEIGDPCFVDIENGDFRLKEESPAFRLGFEQIAISCIGLTSDFPKQYDEIVRRELGENYDDFKKLESICKIKKVEDDDYQYSLIN